MRACGESGACRVVRSAFTRRWRAGGYWRWAVVAVVVAPADVSQWVSARGTAGRRARVCRHTDSTHGVCPRAHVWSARRTRRRSSERDMTAEIRPGALTHGSRVYSGLR